MPERSEEQYAEAFRRLEEQGVNLRSFYSEGMNAMLGKTGTTAVVFHLGESAFLDPATFVRLLFRLFGIGAFGLLNGMLAKGAALKNSETPGVLQQRLSSSLKLG